MVEFSGMVGIKDKLIAVPVALGDVSDVQNALLDENFGSGRGYHGSSVRVALERVLRYPHHLFFACQGLTLTLV